MPKIKNMFINFNISNYDKFTSPIYKMTNQKLKNTVRLKTDFYSLIISRINIRKNKTYSILSKLCPFFLLRISQNFQKKIPKLKEETFLNYLPNM